MSTLKNHRKKGKETPISCTALYNTLLYIIHSSIQYVTPTISVTPAREKVNPAVTLKLWL